MFLECKEPELPFIKKVRYYFLLVFHISGLNTLINKSITRNLY